MKLNSKTNNLILKEKIKTKTPIKKNQIELLEGEIEKNLFN